MIIQIFVSDLVPINAKLVIPLHPMFVFLAKKIEIQVLWIATVLLTTLKNTLLNVKVIILLIIKFIQTFLLNRKHQKSKN
jgi:hypothetical protein